MRSITIPLNIQQHNQPMEVLAGKLDSIHYLIDSLYTSNPEVSIIIPAYNEEASILKTLSSLSANITKKAVEIIVVNNNSTDKTAELAIAAGVICITETTEGVTAARNAGLQISNGKYILNADADTIYPPVWIDMMLSPLIKNDHIAMVYGCFAFIPGTGISRLGYAVYEYFSDFTKWINKNFRDEAVNIYGFNSAFRRAEGVAAGGFDHPPGTNEDGWLAVKLKKHLNKKLYQVKESRAMVWTSDRRIQIDGGLYRAIVKRVGRFKVS